MPFIQKVPAGEAGALRLAEAEPEALARCGLLLPPGQARPREK